VYTDLKHHQILHYGSARRTRWEFLYEGKKQHVDFQPALNSNNGLFLLDAALHGKGISRMPDFMVSNALREGKLVSVLPECEFAALSIQVVRRNNRRLNKRMRALVGALQQSCAVLNGSV